MPGFSSVLPPARLLVALVDAGFVSADDIPVFYTPDKYNPSTRVYHATEGCGNGSSHTKEFVSWKKAREFFAGEPFTKYARSKESVATVCHACSLNLQVSVNEWLYPSQLGAPSVKPTVLDSVPVLLGSGSAAYVAAEAVTLGAALSGVSSWMFDPKWASVGLAKGVRAAAVAFLSKRNDLHPSVISHLEGVVGQADAFKVKLSDRLFSTNSGRVYRYGEPRGDLMWARIYGFPQLRPGGADETVSAFWAAIGQSSSPMYPVADGTEWLMLIDQVMWRELKTWSNGWAYGIGVIIDVPDAARYAAADVVRAWDMLRPEDEQLAGFEQFVKAVMAAQL